MSKQTYQINQTQDYSIFCPNDFQRPVLEDNVKKIAESMKNDGFFPFCPIIVQRQGKYLKVLMGHHRLAAAKMTRTPIYYQIVEGHFTLENDFAHSPKVWTLRDIATYWAAEGRASYAALLKYVELGIPISTAAALLSGNTGGAISKGSKGLSDGTFQVNSTYSIDKIVQAMKELKHLGKVVRSRHFIDTMAAFLLVPEFSMEVMIHKIIVNPRMLDVCANREQMMDQCEEIYNRQTKGAKISLKLAALNKITERRDAYYKRKSAA